MQNQKKEHLEYVVIILNYNTIDDAVQAANSVVDNAIKENYLICIIDNCSPKENERKKILSCSVKNTITFLLEKNKGYAAGNNAGIRLLAEKYTFDYIVVMNPDVCLNKKGTIENLIEDIKNDLSAVGAQPLVNNIDDFRPVYKQTNIRRVGTFTDVLIRNFVVFRKIFKKRMEHYMYYENIPYVQKQLYEVPSGAFFLIDAATFQSVDLFDERTFLYNEEEILGHKIRTLGKYFILNPCLIVDHFQGKSTGSHNGTMSEFSIKCLKDSNEVYMRYYLKCSKFQILLVKLLITLDYKIQKLKKI